MLMSLSLKQDIFVALQIKKIWAFGLLNMVDTASLWVFMQQIKASIPVAHTQNRKKLSHGEKFRYNSSIKTSQVSVCFILYLESLVPNSRFTNKFAFHAVLFGIWFKEKRGYSKKAQGSVWVLFASACLQAVGDNKFFRRVSKAPEV